MPALFADLYKPVKDHLTKNYNGDKSKFEVKAKGGSGLVFNPVLPKGGAASLTIEKPYTVPLGTIKAKLGFNENSLTAKFTADKLKVAGLKIESSAELDNKEGSGKDSAELSVELQKPKCTNTAKASFKGTATNIVATTSFNVLDTTVGFQATTDTKTFGLNSWTTGFQWKHKDASFAGLLDNDKDNKKSLQIGFVSLYKPQGISWGAEYLYKLSTGKVGITVGLETALQHGQTLKLRANNAGVLAGSLAVKVNPELKLTVSAESKGTEAPKTGIVFNWEN